MKEKEIAKDKRKEPERKKGVKKGLGKRVEELTKEIGTYKARLSECEDRFLRLAADYDNYKKRTAREFGELIRNANEDLISQLIPVVDNFERALAAAQSSDGDSFHQGIDMIYQQLKDLLEKQGVQEIEAINEPFDPHKHEAVMVVEKEGAGPETVVEEVEKGYLLHDKVLRPAKVAVSK